jgi:hypothetical protein
MGNYWNYAESSWDVWQDYLQDTVTWKDIFLKWDYPINPPTEATSKKDETASYIICESDTTAYVRVYHLGGYFMELADCLDAPK